MTDKEVLEEISSKLDSLIKLQTETLQILAYGVGTEASFNKDFVKELEKENFQQD